MVSREHTYTLIEDQDQSEGQIGARKGVIQRLATKTTLLSLAVSLLLAANVLQFFNTSEVNHDSSQCSME